MKFLSHPENTKFFTLHSIQLFNKNEAKAKNSKEIDSMRKKELKIFQRNPKMVFVRYRPCPPKNLFHIGILCRVEKFS